MPNLLDILAVRSVVNRGDDQGMKVVSAESCAGTGRRWRRVLCADVDNVLRSLVARRRLRSLNRRAQHPFWPARRENIVLIVVSGEKACRRLQTNINKAASVFSIQSGKNIEWPSGRKGRTS